MSLSLRLKSFLVGLLIVTLLLTLLTRPFASHAQNPTTVESDDPRVFQNGTWASQSAPAASNGSYLYNGPSPVGAGLRPAQSEPVLALAFVGSAIEIIYVSGPQFGTLSIEIDGTVLRTVITTAEKIDYGQSAQVNYLSDEPHSLKVYAQEGGIIAVDAFRITPVTPFVGDGTGPSQAIPTTDDGSIQSSICVPLNVTHRVSLTITGAQANSTSAQIALSNDGRFAAFSTNAPLALGDSDLATDIYVYDHQTCTVQLVSVSSTGVKGNSSSSQPALSADGRFVAFESIATNLVANDTNFEGDIFVHDRQTGQTTRVSVNGSSGQATDGSSHDPALSADGRYVAFRSAAINLSSGSDTNGSDDIFLRDRQTSITTRISLGLGGNNSNSGSYSPSISADGSYVAYESSASNLVAVDTNGTGDAFVYEIETATTTRVSVATGGTQANGITFSPFISADGRYVVFESGATNLVAGDTNAVTDVFIHDRQTFTTTRVSVATGGTQASGNSYDPFVSGEGRYIVFQSNATNLVGGDTNGQRDVFVHDRQTNTTIRASLSSAGTQATGGFPNSPTISTDGRSIGFESTTANLVPGDTNGVLDVFVTPRSPTTTDTLALFNPPYKSVGLFDTLADNPAPERYTTFSAYAPISGGQWVMGDWNGDGVDTPGVYANGPFYYTNKFGESQPSDWRSLWIGIAGSPVSGRFNGAVANDCIGAVQQSTLGGSTVFVLYFTCQLDGTPAPTISSQWLSAVLPNSGGFSGAHQFKAGDFNGDGVDSIAVRRGTFIAFGNVAPSVGPATFDLAQFIGAPLPDASIFVVGNWDNDPFDSFGLFYQNGEFFFRNDLLFNSGAFANQSIGQPFAGTVQATTWR